MKIITVTKNPTAYRFLSTQVRPLLRDMLRYLSQSYKFKLPDRVYLIKYKMPKKQCAHCVISCKPELKKIKCCWGKTGTSGKYDIFVSINIPACLRNGHLVSTVAHEAAHIADKIISGTWSHGKDYEKIEGRVLTEFMKGGRHAKSESVYKRHVADYIPPEAKAARRNGPKAGQAK